MLNSNENVCSRYEWKKDGLPLEINGIDYKRLPGVGTLVIDAPKDVHEGEYQCLAKNELGTALSIKASLKLAGMLHNAHFCSFLILSSFHWGFLISPTSTIDLHIVCLRVGRGRLYPFTHSVEHRLSRLCHWHKG